MMIKFIEFDFLYTRNELICFRLESNNAKETIFLGSCVLTQQALSKEKFFFFFIS